MNTRALLMTILVVVVAVIGALAITQSGVRSGNANPSPSPVVIPSASLLQQGGELPSPVPTP
jgi:hypothetical protein